MKRNLSRLIKVTGSVGLAMALLYPSVSLAQRCEQWVAKAVSVQGVVEFQGAGEANWQRVKLNDIFCKGDKLRAQGKKPGRRCPEQRIRSPPQ